MKKGFLRCVVIAVVMVLFSVSSVLAADDGKNFISNKVGVGYQGMVVGSFLNGISVRGWVGDRIGMELSGYYGKIDASIDEGGVKTDIMKADAGIIEGKVMYAFITRSFSKFYAGGKLGFGRFGVTGSDLDGTTFWNPGVFIGSEWSFPQLPEVGFNFDVGYSWLRYDNKVSNDPYAYLNLDMNSVNATFGIHYYF